MQIKSQHPEDWKMITKYDLLKRLEKETLRRIEHNLQWSYQDLRELILDLHRQLNASMGHFETDQEIYEMYIKNNKVIQKFNTYSSQEENVYWDAVTYNEICKKRLGINGIYLNLEERESIRGNFRSETHKIAREFDLKGGYISNDEWEKTRKNITSNLQDFTKY
jgi:hypothetical protein